MAEADDRYAKAKEEMLELTALGLKHLDGAKNDLINKNDDLIVDAVMNLMLQEQCTLERAAYLFFLDALKTQQRAKLFEMGDEVRYREDWRKREGA